MNIFETAIKRILVRTVDKTISTAGRNATYNATDYNPQLPSTLNLILNTISFAFLTYIISSLFIIFDLRFLAYITPLFFITRIYRPLFSKFIYGKKQQAFTVADRRFKSGRRTEGYRIVKDKDVKYNFTEKQIKTSRIEGLIKLGITGFIILNAYNSLNSIEHRMQNLTDEQVLALLKDGDSIFAKDKETDILIKEKEIEYRNAYKNKREIVSENISYQNAYFEKTKYIGNFVKLDIDTAKILNTFNDKYLVIKCKEKNKWKYKKRKETDIYDKEYIRADSLFYVKLSDIKMSNTKLLSPK